MLCVVCTWRRSSLHKTPTPTVENWQSSAPLKLCEHSQLSVHCIKCRLKSLHEIGPSCCHSTWSKEKPVHVTMLQQAPALLSSHFSCSSAKPGASPARSLFYNVCRCNILCGVERCATGNYQLFTFRRQRCPICIRFFLFFNHFYLCGRQTSMGNIPFFYRSLWEPHCVCFGFVYI